MPVTRSRTDLAGASLSAIPELPLDSIVPVATLRGYVSRAKAAGDAASLVEVPEAGHFELVTPGSTAWEAVKAAFREPR